MCSSKSNPTLLRDHKNSTVTTDVEAALILHESVELGTKPKLHGISRAGNKTLTTWNQSSQEQNLNYIEMRLNTLNESTSG